MTRHAIAQNFGIVHRCQCGTSSHWVCTFQVLVHTGCAHCRFLFTLGMHTAGSGSHWVCTLQVLVHTGCAPHRFSFILGIHCRFWFTLGVHTTGSGSHLYVHSRFWFTLDMHIAGFSAGACGSKIRGPYVKSADSHEIKNLSRADFNTDQLTLLPHITQSGHLLAACCVSGALLCWPCFAR